MQKASVLQALLQFVRFGLPWDFRTTITIARGGGALRRTFRHSLSSPATRPRRGLRSWDAEASANGWRVTRYSADASHLSRAAACWIAGRNRAMGPQMGKRRADAAQRQGRSPRLPRGNAQRQRGHVAIRSAMSGKGMPSIPRPQENEGVGEHVRTRFHFDREATREIAEPKESAPHRTKKTRFFCRTVKRTIRPLT